MPEEVKKFLLEFKTVASEKGVFLLDYRQDTYQTLQYLGLTKQNVEEILLSLSVTDFSSGPEPDRNRDGEIWEFGYDLDGQEIYIKLKLDTFEGELTPKCLSFHIPKHPIKYPLKD